MDKKLLKRQLAVITAIVLGFALFDFAIYTVFTRRCIDRASEGMQAKSVELDKYLPFAENTLAATVETDFALSGDLPVLDGAAALYPVFAGIAGSVYPEESIDFDGENFTKQSALQYSNTRGAYKAVVDGDADIIFCAGPSKGQLEYAEEKGVELELVPIGREAFVFIVNVDNPVDDLSAQQVRDIFSGKITRWSQVGGSDRLISPIQRNTGSGSQTAMLSFMGGEEMPHDFDAAFGSAIGYSFRFYVEDIAKENGAVKMLSLDGVYPSAENVKNESYPIVSSFYAVYDKDNSNENVKKLIEWILSDEGQQVIEKSGYAGLG